MAIGVYLGWIRYMTPSWSLSPRANFFVKALWTGGAVGSAWLVAKRMLDKFQHLDHDKHSLNQLKCKMLLKEAEKANGPQKKETLDQCRSIFALLPVCAATEEIGVLLAKQYIDINGEDQAALCVKTFFNSSSCWKIIDHVKQRPAVDINLMKQLLNRVYDTLHWNLDKKQPLSLVEETLRLGKARDQWGGIFSASDVLWYAQKHLSTLEGVDRVRAECLFLEYAYACPPSGLETAKANVQDAYLRLNGDRRQMEASLYLANSYHQVGLETLAQQALDKIQSDLNDTPVLDPDDLLHLGMLNKVFTIPFADAVEKVKSRFSKESLSVHGLLKIAYACIKAGHLPLAVECIQEAFAFVKTLPPKVSHNAPLVFEVIELHRTYVSIENQDVIADVFEPFYNELIPLSCAHYGAKVLALRNTKQEYDKAKTFLTAHLKKLKDAPYFQYHLKDLFDQLLFLTQSSVLPQPQKQLILDEAAQLLPKLNDQIGAAIQLADAYLDHDFEQCRQMSKKCEILINTHWRLNITVITAVVLVILWGTAAVFRPSLIPTNGS
jgi:hypothetical protein